MKKILITLLSILTVTTSVFSLDTVATTYQTNLKPSDMVEIFVEEINRDNYRYQIADYKVYTEPEKQNYAWSVSIDNDGYIEGRTKVYERSVFLFIKNGYICFKTFGGPTTSGMKDCIDCNSEGGRDKIRDSLYDAIEFFTDRSLTWLKRYNKNYSEDELEALVMLNSIYTFSSSYDISKYELKRTYSNLLTDSTIRCVESSTLNWVSPSWLSGSNEELLLLSFCKKHNTQFLVENCGMTPYKDKDDYKKSELKKLKKEGYDKILDFRIRYRFYKVQDNKIVCALVDFYPYYMIDDILLGNYKYSWKIGNTEFKYHERFYRYVDNQDNIIYEYSE